jgi:trehalose/maltose hydrolase-like predicted phosphorylase
MPSDPSPLGAAGLDRRFEAVVLFTDQAGTPDLVQALQDLLAAEVHVVVITAEPVAAVVDGLSIPPGATSMAFVAGRHGGEIAVVGGRDPQGAPAGADGGAVERLRAAAAATVEELAGQGVRARSSSPSSYERDVVIEVVPPTGPDGVPSADIGELVAYGRATSASVLHGAATRAALAAGIEDPRVWTDDGRVEIATVDERDALRLALSALWRHGVSTSGVLVVADEAGIGPRGCALTTVADTLEATVLCATGHALHTHPGTLPLPGGHAAVLDVLRGQGRHRRERSLPAVAPEPGWGLHLDGVEGERERVDESLVVLADGEVGTSGAPVVADESARPWTIVAGVYELDGPETHLLEGPVPSRIGGRLERAGFRRTLDLHSGTLGEVAPTDEGRITAVRFSSLARPGTVVERIACPSALDPIDPLRPPEGGLLDEGSHGGVAWMRVAASQGGIAAASVAGRDHPGASVYERVTAFAGDALQVPDAPVARALDARETGFDRLLGEHRAEWAQRWLDADIAIEGDERLQAAVRFSLFHLMSSVRDHGEAAVGARGLTGPGYRGHVFWDADTFVLPFLAATHPASARAMLEYRIRRLPVAAANARAMGRRGARFPWESARRGIDVTPTTARDRAGRLVPIRTGQLEDHIVADVAWASSCYEEWTGDDDYRRGDGLRVVVETARYWASRIRTEADGSAHIYGVIGPDEYHEPVDDNTYTNVMARWNLRQAAAAVERLDDPGIPAEERERWLALADALVDGYDSDTGIYEQCARFFSLEPVLIAEVAPRRPIAADYLLGPERVRQAQIIKQPDVLMLHHLVPDEVVRGTLEPNLRYYEPRTAHGSSLSPAVYAALFARARDFDRALDALRIASRIDLDDLTGTTASGLHLATMGGLWQALAMGFAGLRPRAGRLRVDPLLPKAWSALEVRVRFHGSRVCVRRDRTQMTITAQRPVDVVVDDRTYSVDGRGLVFVRRYDTWRLTP